MDVTPQMTSKWVKAAFLIMLGIVLLLYSDGLVDDLERNSAEEFNVEFEWTWDLVRLLLWILIAWLFIDAVLIIVLSLKTEIYTVDDVMAKLKGVEKRLSAQPASPPTMPTPENEVEEYPVMEPPETPEDDLPPPVD